MHKIIIFLSVFFLAANAANASDVDDQLIYRAASGSAADVKLLLDQGADPNAKNGIGRPVIVIAAARNHVDSAKIVQNLAEKGANPSLADAQGENAFTAAIASGTIDTINYLLSWRPTYKMTNGLGEDLPAIAKKRQDAKVFAADDKLKNDEISEWASNTSGQARQRMLRDFAFKACTEEYLLFYYGNEPPEDVNPDVYDKQMKRANDDINLSLAVLKKYFSLSRGELGKLEQTARKSISIELDAMGSQNYRKRGGVGTDADLQKRCGKIALDLSLRTSLKRKVAK